jgi:hypothetical protein
MGGRKSRAAFVLSNLNASKHLVGNGGIKLLMIRYYLYSRTVSSSLAPNRAGVIALRQR